MEKFGVYVHIPFCIQRCHYCDFATYALDQISPNDQYVDMVCKEILNRRSLYREQRLDTLYFGGGTPSLLSPQQLDRIVSTLARVGLPIVEDTEVTIEVNPATLTEEKCIALKEIGFNRVSIGCQSFDDRQLKACNREHSAEQTRRTIELVQNHFANFSLDLLFALPQQGLQELERDIDEFLSYGPPHVSAYCLTVPEKHPMNQNRVSDSEQVKMFQSVLSRFAEAELQRYELSNFCREGFQSSHNNLYWTDQNYWGVGLSAHSYRKTPDQGFRFWNPRTYDSYFKQMEELQSSSEVPLSFPAGQWEKLELHEALTDFCHTRLRLAEGLPMSSVRQKFGEKALALVAKKLEKPQRSGLVIQDDNGFRLSDRGFVLSNQVFAGLLISPEEIDRAQFEPIL